MSDMENQGKVILTNMCMLYRPDGSFLVEMREKKDWPGLTFPGGHVEKEESILDSVVREMREETGYEVSHLEPCGYYEWNIPKENVRHLCLLFKSKDFEGSLRSSKEGKVFWIKEEEISHYPLSTDFEALYTQMKRY